MKQDKRNANKGTKRGKDLLAQSLAAYGAGRSVLADKNDELIAGNKTAEQAAKLGLKTRIIETDGTELIVVKRTDLDLSSESDTRARELAYVDNRVVEVDLTWDKDVVAADIAAGLDLEKLGFNETELQDILSGEDDKLDHEGGEGGPREKCPTCGGSGYVAA